MISRQDFVVIWVFDSSSFLRVQTIYPSDQDLQRDHSSSFMLRTPVSGTHAHQDLDPLDRETNVSLHSLCLKIRRINLEDPNTYIDIKQAFQRNTFFKRENTLTTRTVLICSRCFKRSVS
jgi:hypothetical protein